MKEGNHFEKPGENGKIILKWILKNYNGKLHTGFI